MSDHTHRYRFPTPTSGLTYIEGICECGAASIGLAFEASDALGIISKSNKARLKRTGRTYAESLQAGREAAARQRQGVEPAR